MPRKVGEMVLPETRIIIKGLAEQEFHQLGTANTGDYEIVKYDITTSPVSFHHPFHWLLSELFENVSLLHQGVLNELGWLGGFKQMVNDAFDSKDHDMFLMVLEYPIRTIALLSQINCGVWVRNGYSIRNQVSVLKAIIRFKLTFYRLIRTETSMSEKAHWIATFTCSKWASLSVIATKFC